MIAFKHALLTNNITIIPDVTRNDAPKMMQADTALIDISSLIEILQNRNCSVTMLPIDDFVEEMASIVTSKKWPYVELLNRWSQLLSDYYRYTEHVYIASGFPTDCSGGRDGSGPVPLSLNVTWLTFQVGKMKK